MIYCVHEQALRFRGCFSAGFRVVHEASAPVVVLPNHGRKRLSKKEGRMIGTRLLTGIGCREVVMTCMAMVFTRPGKGVNAEEIADESQ